MFCGSNWNDKKILNYDAKQPLMNCTFLIYKYRNQTKGDKVWENETSLHPPLCFNAVLSIIDTLTALGDKDTHTHCHSSDTVS